MNDIHYLFCAFIVIIISTVIHELAHGWTAYALGDYTAKDSGRLSLNPLNHLDPMLSVVLPLVFALFGMPILAGAKPVPINPYNLKGGDWGMALVAAAGPFSNLVLSFIFFVLLTINMNTGFGGDLFFTFATAGTIVNLSMMLFNLIPIPPLDGSRILYALAPEPIQRFMMVVEQYGFVVVYALLLLGGTVISSYIVGGSNFILSIFQGLLW